MEARTFGAWLRKRRRQLDLTQEALATRVGYSVVTIRKAERDELRPSQQLALRLAQELETAPQQQARIIALARSGGAIPSPTDIATPDFSKQIHLPSQLTPFIGRRAELLELTQLMVDRNCRLVTIVGPGGIGKTRLALEFVQEQALQIASGVYFVSLAPIRMLEHIVPSIADALGIHGQADNLPPKEQLINYLRHKQLLLVLDNFEHLIEGVKLIQELLEGCPTLRLLVTSRERLRLSNETVFTLGGMDVPRRAKIQDEMRCSAVQLFVSTARRIHPRFAAHDENASSIAQICRMVGGLPLAIILAAAWVDTLSPHEIVDELKQGFAFLEVELRDMPDRHHSIRAVLAQSWQKLNEAERIVFMRLSIFRGGFTRQAAQSVAGATLSIINSLINKALMQRGADGRYAIHELLRQYAEAELMAVELAADACNAHSAYYMNFLQQREADIKGRRQLDALDEIDADFDNIRAAWQWAVVQRNYTAVGQTLESLYWFCQMRTRYYEGIALIRTAREQLAPVEGEAPHRVWGQLMARVFGQDYRWFEPPTESMTRIETALAVAQAHNDETEIAFCLWRIAMAKLPAEDIDGAIACHKQSINHYQRLGDRFYLSVLYSNLVILYTAWEHGPRGSQMIDLMVQCTEECRQTGNLVGLSQSLGLMGWGMYSDGRYTEAQAYWEEARSLCHQLDARYALNIVQLGLIWYALFFDGDFDRSRTIAEDMQQTLSDINDFQSQLHPLIVSGFLASMEEDYRSSNDYFQQAIALSFPDFSYTAALELMGLCLAACGLGRGSHSTPHLVRAMEICLKNQWPANVAKTLTIAAILLFQIGRPLRATELLSLVFHDPASPKGWLRHWLRIPRLRSELESTLAPDIFADAWTRGAQLELVDTAKRVMTELATTTATVS